jgi:hypothetical protein
MKLWLITAEVLPLTELKEHLMSTGFSEKQLENCTVLSRKSNSLERCGKQVGDLLNQLDAEH